MSKLEKDLKEEEGTSTGADQTEKKQTGSEGEGEGKKSQEETVTISKSELEDLKKKSVEKDNLSEAVIRLNKNRGRILPGLEPVKKPTKKDEFDDDKDVITEEYLDKRDAIREGKQAIRKACEDKEVALHWFDIVEFYRQPKESNFDSVLSAISKAHKLWRADKGITGKSDEVKKAEKAKQDLAAETGTKTGKEKETKSIKKRIIPRKEKMKDWFPEKK